MTHGFSLTPKEGAGRSNRLGDANNIRGLADKADPLCSLCIFICILSENLLRVKLAIMEKYYNVMDFLVLVILDVEG
jgi:hypothetical protein